MSSESVTKTVNNLTECDREPIRIPGRIQGHGALLAIADGRISQVSENLASFLGLSPKDALGRRLDDVMPPEAAALIGTRLDVAPSSGMAVRAANIRLPVGDKVISLGAIVHRSADVSIVELEPTPEGNSDSHEHTPDLGPFLDRLRAAMSLGDVSAVTADEVRQLTGFDRVLIYRFDAEWNGTVVAESGNEKFSTLLDHRFPASDIPAQARELYSLNRLRIIPDAYRPTVALEPSMNPATGSPLDLSFSTLRSVSPVHIEYMKNMGTAASMSISIMVGDRLWGLIACHNRAPRGVPFSVRRVCDFIGQLMSLQIPAHENVLEINRRIEIKSIQSRLLGSMAAEDTFIDGLQRRTEDLLRIADATGAAVLFEDGCVLIGETPTEEQVRRVADWLSDHSQKGIFESDEFSSVFPEAQEYKAVASGVLAISISQIYRSYILWFRPEIVRTVKWAGDPKKSIPGPQGRIHPRNSFETWQQIVRNQSIPWSDLDRESVTELRTAVVNIVLRRAEELAQLNSELRRSNQELEAFSYSVSHDLRAPFRHIVGYANLLRDEESSTLSADGRRYLETILESAEFAGTLVDNLLSLSRVGRAALRLGKIDLNVVAHQVQNELAREQGDRKITWRIASLPTVEGDLVLLRLVLQNLMGNAFKFTKGRAMSVIEMGVIPKETENVIFVRDNGVGFDMQFVDKLFGVFQRLHRADEFEGTGIGLATVRRIISRHGGRVWAEGEPGQGATFYFTLPTTYSLETSPHA